MSNYSWQTERPFNAYSNYMRKKFSSRVQKLSIDAGFSCPNRDGKLSTGGCSFCSNEAFNPSYCRKFDSITTQIDEGIKFHSWRYKKAGKYLAYFQPYSNTYAPLDVLKERYGEALSHPEIIGLVIGTRPDCVDNEKLDYLQELNQHHHIVIEYGIESCYDKTLQAVNRGHDFACTINAIQQAHKRGLEVGGHLIFGFPTETREQMLKEAEILSSLPIDNLKFHQLQILSNTAMQKDYQSNPDKYHFFEFEQYTDFIIEFLERLNPHIIIERFASEVPPRYNVGKSWNTLQGDTLKPIRNEQIVQTIENKMIALNTYQGRLFNKS